MGRCLMCAVDVDIEWTPWCSGMCWMDYIVSGIPEDAWRQGWLFR